MEIIPRSEVPLAPPTAALTPMTQPDGWVVHYVGAVYPPTPTITQGKAQWARLQQGAFDGDNGETYIDIPYNFGIDLAGRIYEGRGWQFKGAANGSTNYNAHAWSVCVMCGPGQAISDVVKAALSWLTQEGARRVAAVSYVKGHRDVYATACPGDPLYAYVPHLNAHLHDPQNVPHVDWDAIAKLVKWQQRCKARPLTRGMNNPDVRVMNDLLAAHGYNRVVGSGYGRRSEAAIYAFKVAKNLPNRDGKVCGGDCASALLGR